MSGGVTIHLGPFIPFTTDDTVTIDINDVVVRTSITDQFIGFYDEACTAWLDMRENDTIEIKSTKQDFQEQQKQLTSLIEDRMKRMSWEDYPEEEDLFEYENILLYNIYSLFRELTYSFYSTNRDRSSTNYEKTEKNYTLTPENMQV